MTDPPEGDRPVPAYGTAGHPPPPPRAPEPPTYGWSPPYGQPQYAPPPPHLPGAWDGGTVPDGQGPPKRRSGLLWTLVAVAAAFVAVAVVLSSTLHTRVLDRAAVERDVAAQFQEHEGVAIRLDCTDSMALTTGATYRCRGRTASGESVTLLIRVTDARRAGYTWSELR